MATYNTRRPNGDAGRGRHTGKVGWLGGKHRTKDGCFAAFIGMLLVVGGTIGGAAYGVVQLFS
jgi:hypothetical protein